MLTSALAMPSSARVRLLGVAEAQHYVGWRTNEDSRLDRSPPSRGGSLPSRPVSLEPGASLGLDGATAMPNADPRMLAVLAG